jgi:hypothetical protein
VCGNPKADTKMLQRSLDQIKETVPANALRQVACDRGFDSKANGQLLEKQAIYNAICPKAQADLKERMREGQFAELQKRRLQTETRIAIFKNGYLSNPLSSKLHEHQKQDEAWCVLAHDLLVLARLPKRNAKALAKAG